MGLFWPGGNVCAVAWSPPPPGPAGLRPPPGWGRVNTATGSPGLFIPRAGRRANAHHSPCPAHCRSQPQASVAPGGKGTRAADTASTQHRGQRASQDDASSPANPSRQGSHTGTGTPGPADARQSPHNTAQPPARSQASRRGTAVGAWLTRCAQTLHTVAVVTHGCVRNSNTAFQVKLAQNTPTHTPR